MIACGPAPLDLRRSLEHANDCLLLRRASFEQVSAILRLHPPVPDLHLFRLLASPSQTGPRDVIEVDVETVGSYLISRLLLRRFDLRLNVTACMFALADAVRAMSTVDILRWRYILATVIRARSRDSAAVRLLRQTRIVVDTLAQLSDPEEFQWETAVLQVR